ncbi:MAG: hypothetical protein ABIJ46_00195 [bacterium]
MIDVEKLVALVNATATSEGERKAWIKLITLLPVEQIEELMGLLQSEQDQLTALRQEYLAKAQKIVADEA